MSITVKERLSKTNYLVLNYSLLKKVNWLAGCDEELYRMKFTRINPDEQLIKDYFGKHFDIQISGTCNDYVFIADKHTFDEINKIIAVNNISVINPFHYGVSLRSNEFTRIGRVTGTLFLRILIGRDRDKEKFFNYGIKFK